MSEAKKPLNGTKTHPLSEHALGVLRLLSEAMLGGHTINPGVRDRLSREGLAEQNGRFWQITDEGRARLAEQAIKEAK